MLAVPHGASLERPMASAFSAYIRPSGSTATVSAGDRGHLPRPGFVHVNVPSGMVQPLAARPSAEANGIAVDSSSALLPGAAFVPPPQLQPPSTSQPQAYSYVPAAGGALTSRSSHQGGLQLPSEAQVREAAQGLRAMAEAAHRLSPGLDPGYPGTQIPAQMAGAGGAAAAPPQVKVVGQLLPRVSAIPAVAPAPVVPKQEPDMGAGEMEVEGQGGDEQQEEDEEDAELLAGRALAELAAQHAAGAALGSHGSGGSGGSVSQQARQQQRRLRDEMMEEMMEKMEEGGDEEGGNGGNGGGGTGSSETESEAGAGEGGQADAEGPGEDEMEVTVDGPNDKGCQVRGVVGLMVGIAWEVH